jgi:galactose mutarotase-like enzyme
MITLANDQIALTLEPAFGARVTSLTDLASGRQWLVAGDCTDGDAYLGDQARGWDECFPTVGLCHHAAWGGPMRDHGELWGRKWSVTQDADGCAGSYGDPRFAFSRRLALKGATVIATYRVTNRGSDTLPYLWSQHALLATTPADRIALDGIAGMRVMGQPVDWPNHPDRNLSTIGTADEGFALKLYGDAQNAASAEVVGPDGGIRFDWSGAGIPAFGLWLDYGGWPPTAPVHQVALEPTTAPADDLAQAGATGHARHLAPGETHRWSVRITLTPSRFVPQ